MRTGAFQGRKARGAVNPADLFTKHLPSSIKIAQLVKLFGCECRQGRSAAAPLLRPQESAEGQGGEPSGGHLPAFELREAEAHDIEVLPHLHSEGDLDRLFPMLRAPLRRRRVWRTGSCTTRSEGEHGQFSRLVAADDEDERVFV